MSTKEEAGITLILSTAPIGRFHRRLINRITAVKIMRQDVVGERHHDSGSAAELTLARASRSEGIARNNNEVDVS